jgi:hypothetical protein
MLFQTHSTILTCQAVGPPHWETYRADANQGILGSGATAKRSAVDIPASYQTQAYTDVVRIAKQAVVTLLPGHDINFGGICQTCIRPHTRMFYVGQQEHRPTKHARGRLKSTHEVRQPCLIPA